jgi:hypothetical protein
MAQVSFPPFVALAFVVPGKFLLLPVGPGGLVSLAGLVGPGKLELSVGLVDCCKFVLAVGISVSDKPVGILVMVLVPGFSVM